MRSIALGFISSNLAAASMVRYLVAGIGFLIRLVYTVWDGNMAQGGDHVPTLSLIYTHQGA